MGWQHGPSGLWRSRDVILGLEEARYLIGIVFAYLASLALHFDSVSEPWLHRDAVYELAEPYEVAIGAERVISYLCEFLRAQKSAALDGFYRIEAIPCPIGKFSLSHARFGPYPFHFRAEERSW